jgi:dTMP kinase
MKERGKLIVFEGIGGCGKGTQIDKLKNYLEDLKKRVIVSCEHTRDTPPGALIEDIIKKRKDGIDPTALQLLFVSDRANHTERIIKSGVERCDFFLEDRYRGSTISYAVPKMRKFFLELNEAITIEPDLVLIIDLDPVEAARRVGKRGDADIFDTAKKLNVCREGYKWYSENSSEPCVWIDGNGTREEVFERVKSEIIRRKFI